MRRALVTVLVAWGLIFARVVHAEPSLRLDVATSPGAEPCGGADELRARISEGLGRDPFTAPPDALARLRPYLDGLILTFGSHRGTFLPQVWEQLPAPGLFLAHLKRKAGLPQDWWHPDVRLQRYTVTAFREDPPTAR